MSEPTSTLEGTTMKNLVLTTITAGALASAALGLAGTANAAVGPSPVAQTVGQLRSQGFHVIVNRGRLRSLTSARSARSGPARRFSAHRLRRTRRRRRPRSVTTVTNGVVYVDVAC